MKKLLLITILLISLFSACKQRVGECRIHGTVNKPNLEGKCIYLIAYDGSIRESVGIDSAFIENGKFEITTNKHMMGIIRMDYRYRYGTQELLVVEEPGDVYVTIDSISSCRGTTNNDQLQAWKSEVEVMQSKGAIIGKAMFEAKQKGDTLVESTCKATLKRLNTEQKKRTLDRAEKLNEGPLKEFFYKMYGAAPNNPGRD